MKKSIIYTTVLAAAALVGVGTLVAISTANAETIDAPLGPVSSLVADLASSQTINTSKDETVYVIANANGETNKTFVGNTIYTGSEALPFDFSVKYYLDGTEIDASSLAHKSGHVKIVFSYRATSYYQGKQIPFLALTGLTLDATKFSNVAVDHGKIINTGDTLALVGYALPGANYDLGTDFLWDEFTVTADVTDFELPTTYSVLTSEIFSELDTSKLSDLDSLVNSMNDLSSGLDQIITGADSLENGLKTLAEKSTELVSGVNDLSAGLAELTANNDSLTSGADSIYSQIVLPAISAQISENAELMAAIAAYQISFPLTLDNYATSIPAITQILKTKIAPYEEQLATLDPASPQYSAIVAAITPAKTTIASLTGVQNFYDGIYAYTAGTTEVAAGVAKLKSSLPALITGETDLYNGSIQLTEGLATFKSDGIDKLVNFANQDLAKFTRDARATVNAAASYRHFSNDNATSVKFIIKTPSIK